MNKYLLIRSFYHDGVYSGEANQEVSKQFYDTWSKVKPNCFAVQGPAGKVFSSIKDLKDEIAELTKLLKEKEEAEEKESKKSK